MGGRGKSRTQRKHFRQNRENVWKRSKPDPDPSLSSDKSQTTHWTPFSTENPSFDSYYKEQLIVDPQEWDQFVAILRTPLPASFRINASSQFADDIRSQLENDFVHSLRAEVAEGGETEAIRPLPWYPGNFAWHSNFSRMQLRKNQTLERFHEFLKLENEIGNITRQEAVSMVPPLFLDVHSDHLVLDMCAAPGSKTFQLLEIIHQSTKAGSLPDGMVIANDLDVKRCNLLIHQTKRMCTANLIVTNHEAQHFPGCRLKGNSERMKLDHDIHQLLFDRVLCDVPCSGDGTLRKAPDMWRKWNSGMGQGLHSLQVLIAMRGDVLRRCGESVKLVDVSSELPQLIRRPGLKRWKVYDKSRWFVSSKDVPKFRRSVILASMFPSGKGYQDLGDSSCNVDMEDDITSVENGTAEDGVEAVENPVMSDFVIVFVLAAVLEKPSKQIDEQYVEPLNQSLADAQAPQINSSESKLEEVLEAVPEENVNDNVSNKEDLEVSPLTCEEHNSEETEKPHNEENTEKKFPSKRKLQIQGQWRGVDPVVYFKDEAIINSIRTFYGIDERFPFNGHLITRNSDTSHVKRIYYVSKFVKDILQLNFAVGQQLKITSVGMKMFERQTAREGSSSPCAFRISSEGLPLILPYITKQIIQASPVDFKRLLQDKDVKYTDFADAEFGEKAANLLPGCCVVILGKGNAVATESLKVDESTIAIGCWRGRARLSVMVTAMDCQEMLERLLIRLGTENGSSGHVDISSNDVGGEVQSVQESNDDDVKVTVS
ncbi:hypothetical protein TSUD_79560 [Trifolium subterraneum]|uniref:SAM-dependent MTase RsmB/NOP-type domain-containing protein n=1 Tax=Trifolium subterraneum TaxID=3900 RepID=A0A2Z6MAI0_TRISU|nr:hypothetical protein TSUD_79560 [Trifolium subterraneum]